VDKEEANYNKESNLEENQYREDNESSS